MRYYSTNHKTSLVSFKDALLQGQAPDRGLYLPETIPKIPKNVIESFANCSYAEIASEVAKYLIDDEVPIAKLQEITQDAYNFDVPLINLVDNRYIMRLDQGPTASFKDFAARMMARLMQYFLKQDGQRLVILVATSGDTGGAIADAFYGLDNIDVIVLYPKKEISDRQRRQMTTLGKNITAIGLDAKFDDCQALVKEAFADNSLSHIPLSSANSINFGRLLPQTVYYFWAYSRIVKKEGSIIFTVPSGNFGDLMGGILAREMGLPVEKFVVAVNENNEFVQFLEDGVYQKIVPSKNCLSSAMNVGHPSNLARIIDLYEGHLDEKGFLHKVPYQMEKMRKDFWAISISDEQTRQTIKETYDTYQYVLEPHGAVAWAGQSAFLSKNPTSTTCVAFETADPAKFPDQIIEMIGVDPEMPQNMKDQQDRPEFLIDLTNDYEKFKEFLKTKYH